MKTKIIITIILTLLAGYSYSQVSQEELNQSLNDKAVIIARSYQDSIILRWGLGKPAAWEIACRQGYKIERAELKNQSDKYSDLTFAEIQGSPFKIWTEQQFASYFAVHNENDPQTQEVYLVSVLTGIVDQDSKQPIQAFSAFQDNLNSVRDGKNKLDNKYGFSMLVANKSATAAVALGVRTVDRDIVSGKTYVYKISLAGNSPVYKVQEGYVKVKAEPFHTDQYKTEIFYQDLDEEVILSWNSNSEFSSYIVERALSKKGAYTRLTEAPILNSNPAGFDGPGMTSYNDKNLINYTKYFYRIKGNSAFAQEIMIGEIEVMPRDRTAPEKPFMEMPENTRPDEVLLKWKMNAPIEGDFKGFIVARSDHFDGPFTRINKDVIGLDTRDYVDTTFSKHAGNYYLVQAFDTCNNYSTSNIALATIVDSMPPAVPKIISGTIDSLGVVTLVVEKNKEYDLMGYRLFRANDPEHEFSVIFEGFVDSDTLNSKIPTTFSDTVTLNSLTPRIFYKIRALDFHFNSSDFSEAFVVIRPDTIPPTTPVFKKVICRTNEVELRFNLSESLDVKEQILYRRTKMDAPWEPLVTLNENQTSYIDTTVIQGKVYFYSIRAQDLQGLFSDFAWPIQGKAYDDGVRPIVENLKISTNDGEIIVSWDYPKLNNETFFVVYRADEKGKLKQYKRTSETSIQETQGKSRMIRYAVKTFTTDGGQSRVSPEVSWQAK